MQEKIIQLLSQFRSKTEFAMELAARDAIVNGYGFLIVDKDGNLSYVDIDEASEIISEIDSNR